MARRSRNPLSQYGRGEDIGGHIGARAERRLVRGRRGTITLAGPVGIHGAVAPLVRAFVVLRSGVQRLHEALKGRALKPNDKDQQEG